ncbi:MAG: hypothetical protein WBP11_05310, partial [Dokdonella sp.]
MQRNIASTGKLAGALSIALALPFCISTSAASADAGTRARVGDIDQAVESANPEFNRWRDYALASITPRYSWVSMPSMDDVTPRITDSLNSARPSV